MPYCYEYSLLSLSELLPLLSGCQLRQVVQRRLCSAHFDDVEGTTEQLTPSRQICRVAVISTRDPIVTLQRVTLSEDGLFMGTVFSNRQKSRITNSSLLPYHGASEAVLSLKPQPGTLLCGPCGCCGLTCAGLHLHSSYRVRASCFDGTWL